MKRSAITFAAVSAALFLVYFASGQTPQPQTSLTMQVHWFDGVKASGKITIAGNGQTVTVVDNANGIYTTTLALADDVAYTVSWQSSATPEGKFSIPFIVGYPVRSENLAAAELDLIFNRPTDAGGFRVRSAKLSITKVLP